MCCLQNKNKKNVKLLSVAHVLMDHLAVFLIFDQYELGQHLISLFFLIFLFSFLYYCD